MTTLLLLRAREALVQFPRCDRCVYSPVPPLAISPAASLLSPSYRPVCAARARSSKAPVGRPGTRLNRGGTGIPGSLTPPGIPNFREWHYRGNRVL